MQTNIFESLIVCEVFWLHNIHTVVTGSIKVIYEKHECVMHNFLWNMFLCLCFALFKKIECSVTSVLPIVKGCTSQNIVKNCSDKSYLKLMRSICVSMKSRYSHF